MEIKVSVKTIAHRSDFEHMEPALASIKITDLPISKKHLIGKEIETLVWEAFRSVIKAKYGSEIREIDSFR